jgi:murein DD-endopeptidase MepM/ murein hydrolase activator NlpD
MARRIVLVVLLAVLVAAPAGADDIEKKRSVDAEISELNAKVDETRAREASVKAEIEAASGEILELQQQVGDVSARLGALERELHLREVKLDRLNVLYKLQTERLELLKQEYAVALRRLNLRLVALYESQQPDAIAIFLSARSFTDFLDTLDYLERIGEADKRIADYVGASKRSVRLARARTRKTRQHVQQEARVIALRVAQVRELHDRLAAGQASLEAANAQRQQDLAQLTGSEREALAEIEALEAVSATLAAKIAAAQAARSAAESTSATVSAPLTPSASGFVWPVSGPVVSGFGMRWGRMHEGIDIAVGSGTPIRSAAAGQVIYAGWLGGYGNLVVVDHGGGLATAYAHQSQMASSVGQSVAQGQVIGYVGSTGNSSGPHLHFEVRVNGGAVDPLGYL